MNMLRRVLCSSLLAIGLLAQDASAANVLFGRFDYDSEFREQFKFAAIHFLNDNWGIGGIFAAYTAVKSLDISVGPVFKVDGLMAGLFAATTFGPSSWDFSADKTLRLGRDFGFQAHIHYVNEWIEAETFTNMLFPVQENYNTAIGVGGMRNWVAFRWNNLGLGAFLNPLFSKNPGDSSFQLTHLPFGAVVLADFQKLVMRAFLGHDPIEYNNWLGFIPKKAEPYYRLEAIYHF